MEKQENDLAAYREQKLRDEIDDIVKSLQAVGDQDTARLSERVFVGVFLPFFAGDESPVYDVGLQHWLNVAGSSFASVNVVNERNEVLFTVPPIYDRGAIQPVSKEGGSIANVVASANQYAQLHPSQGTHYLNVELTKRALVMKVPVNVLQHIEVWNKIFARYGRPPIVPLEEEQTKPTAPGASGEEADYEFQPL